MSWNQEKTNVENGDNYVIQLELGNAECGRNAIQGGDPGRRSGGVQGGSLVLLPAESWSGHGLLMMLLENMEDEECVRNAIQGWWAAQKPGITLLWPAESCSSHRLLPMMLLSRIWRMKNAVEECDPSCAGVGRGNKAQQGIAAAAESCSGVVPQAAWWSPSAATL